MPYKHGVYITENPTAISAPVETNAGVQIVIGTAPVNLLADPAGAVNKPILVNTYAEAVAAVGFSKDFASYTLCDAISASFQVVGAGPLVLINVLDPAKHTTALEETTVQVNNKAALLEQTGILLNELKVKKEETPLTAGQDYTATFNDDGYVVIALLESGAGTGATTLKVSGKRIDPDKVSEEDIVGGVDISSGAETGMEVIRQVYPKLGIVPGLLLAPRYSSKATVAAALQAKCTDINGCFKAFCIVDIDSGETGAKKYTDVKKKKEAAAVSSEYSAAVWPFAKVGDVIYAGSSMLAAALAYSDAQNDDTPNVSPSNQSVAISAACLEDGTEVYLDQQQANEVNGMGVVTWLNFNGWRAWGNNTSAYPGTTDPKDRWIGCRRFMSYAANTFVTSYFQKVDGVLNSRLIESIVDSENMRGNAFVARGVCGSYRVEYNEAENPASQLLDGHLVLHMYMSPFPPAEVIEDIIEYDASALETAMAQ